MAITLAVDNTAELRPDALNEIEHAFLECEPVSDAVLLALRDRGVDLNVLADRWRGRPDEFPRQARVEFHDRHFEFVDEPGWGDGALIWMASDETGTPIDLVAYKPGRRLATWRGSASILGVESLFAFRVDDAVRVDSDPLQWLRHGCRGVLVIDLDKAASTLMDADAIEVSSQENARKLRQQFEGRLPRIIVAKPDRRPAPAPLREAA